MKTKTETITVNGQDHDIEFEYVNQNEPVGVISVNRLKAINLTDDFITDCEDACAIVLIHEAFQRSESLAEARGDEERGN